MASDHIVKSFDHELAALRDLIQQMGAISRRQLSAALVALAEQDDAIAGDVVRRDLEVDEMERDLNARALRVLALRQPIARDLREVLSAFRIGIEFERIADHAANIAKRAIALGASADVTLVHELVQLSDLSGTLLERLVEAFRTRDAEEALAVWAHDEHVDHAYAQVHRRIIDWMQPDATRVPAGAHLLFIAKNIERIGDHATNAAEALHFQVTGEWLSTPRPKGDTTSSDSVTGAAE